MAEAARRALGKLAGLSAAVGVVGWAFNECLYTVDGGERAVVWHRFSGGLQQGVKEEGLHFRIPFVEYPKIFDIRLRPRVIATRTGTKDLQTVQISLRVLSRPDEKFLSKIYQDLGEDYDERVLPSIVNEVLKATVANFDAEQLLTQREKVSRQIRDSLNERAAEFHLHLDDVSITHLIFSREFTQAIESKQVAQQEAERSKFIVAKAEQEQKAAIIKAEGESEAATLISNALRTSGTAMLDIRRLEASREIADTLSQARNVVYVPNSGNMLMAMPAAGAGRGAASLA